MERTPAKREGVEIRLYSIIYELIENVENAMKGLLSQNCMSRLLEKLKS